MILQTPATLALSLVEKAEAHTLFTIPLGGYDLNVTQHMFMALVSCVLVLLVFTMIRGRIAVKGSSVEDHITHGRVSQLFEALLVFLRENVARPNLGDLTDKYIYYIWTVFFVVLFANVLGLAPIGQTVALAAYFAGAESAGDYGHYYYWQFWGGPAMANINMTAALATFSLGAIIFIGLKENGVEFLKHFAPVPFTPWPMILIALPLIFIEIMGLFIKSAVLALRLFGNILAGFLVVLALVGLIYKFGQGSEIVGYSVGTGVAVGTVVILFLELFVAFLQTFIFTFLTVLFISQGAVHHGDHDDHAHDEAHGHATATAH